MGQIVDKAASLCQSNELGHTRSIRERETHTQLWQLDDGNHQIIIFTQEVRTNHQYLPGQMDACKWDMLMEAHEHAYVFAPACERGCMRVIVCGVCVGAYSDNNEGVYVDLHD